jgi:VIT1/CCC1 family predicted Fe2+/Mn2+ transporter
MKKFFSPLALIGGIMLLVPYIFLGKQWGFAATFVSVGSAIIILVNIIYILVNMMKKHHIR